ncbi:hypothetical protein BX666DRAFT_1850912 [Dichotomocladium elegans]|nr:hypothetical protein BX666DRAFT_1850912 [Dichotomocladium elegans]
MAETWEYPQHQQFERVPSLNEVDPNDRKAVYAARAQKIRDDWVKAMEARLIKEKLDECYKTEGVNHCTFLGSLLCLGGLKHLLFLNRPEMP